MKIFCNFTNIFTVTFDQFNTSLRSKRINFLQNIHFTDTKLLNSSVVMVVYLIPNPFCSLLDV